MTGGDNVRVLFVCNITYVEPVLSRTWGHSHPHCQAHRPALHRHTRMGTCPCLTLCPVTLPGSVPGHQSDRGIQLPSSHCLRGLLQLPACILLNTCFRAHKHLSDDSQVRSATTYVMMQLPLKPPAPRLTPHLLHHLSEAQGHIQVVGASCCR